MAQDFSGQSTTDSQKDSEALKSVGGSPCQAQGPELVLMMEFSGSDRNAGKEDVSGGAGRRTGPHLFSLLCTQVVKQEDALSTEWESPLMKQNLEIGLG